MHKLIYLVPIVAVVLSILVVTQAPKEVAAPTEEIEAVACTRDAMQCPDGSYVGRTGPNCEFVCPEVEVAPIQTDNDHEVTDPQAGGVPSSPGLTEIPPVNLSPDDGGGDHFDNGGFACTEDAMECPDGTVVGRSGPKCEFVCPGG